MQMRWQRYVKEVLFVLVCCYFAVGDVPEREINVSSSSHNHADVTLIGAYGDLAKKYLWKALFKIYSRYAYLPNDRWTFNFYGAGQRNATVGEKLLQSIVNHVVLCNDFDQTCLAKRSSFLFLIKYVQLKDDLDYAKHCNVIANSSQHHQCNKSYSCDAQNIFYLSVPPYTYETISSYLSLFCKSIHGNVSFKVVYEKPFGHSFSSAQELGKTVGKYLDEQEVYRVDHYLGKQAVQQIVSFRERNLQINDLMDANSVEKIEIVMKETVGVKGRTSYYNKYGVLNDVMQNHLSEILCLMLMDLPSSSVHTNQLKLKTFQQIRSLTQNDVILGQYEGYQEEVMLESPSSHNSTTATFAAVSLHLFTPRWRNIPVLMVAGKMLDERSSYARMVFNEKVFSVEGSKSGCSSRPELIFHIGHGSLGTPAILVSRQLPVNQSYVPNGWSKTHALDDIAYLGNKLECYHVFVPNIQIGAYEFLTEQVFLGHHEHFLSLPVLLESWRVWNTIVEDKNLPVRLYPGSNKTGNLLDFSYDNNVLGFLEMPRKEAYSLEKQSWLEKEMVIEDPTRLFLALARDIMRAATEVSHRAESFHVAFSGGKSPLQLFEFLAAYHRNNLSWMNLHIWQVDERCSNDPDQSNFEALSATLIDNIPHLKYKNIHPMPIQSTAEAMCTNDCAKLYENQLETNLGNFPKLHYVVLGIGTDGHTASLFPYHALLKETERYVAIAKNVPNQQITTRMTLTYPVINSAKAIAVLVTGKNKCAILSELHHSKCEGDEVLKKYPICGVLQNNTAVTFYVDKACNSVFEEHIVTSSRNFKSEL